MFIKPPEEQKRLILKGKLLIYGTVIGALLGALGGWLFS